MDPWVNRVAEAVVRNLITAVAKTRREELTEDEIFALGVSAGCGVRLDLIPNTDSYRPVLDRMIAVQHDGRKWCVAVGPVAPKENPTPTTPAQEKE